VFDSTPEFFNMLNSGAGGKKNLKAYYVDRNARIISTTDTSRSVGDTLEIDLALLSIANGSRASQITVHDGEYAIVACSVSNGYREFKVSDGYQEDVIAVVFESFGAIRGAGTQTDSRKYLLESDPGVTDGSEFATFFSDNNLFAISAAHVVEAVPYSEVLPTSMGTRAEQIGVLGLHRDDELRKEFIWVFDLGQMMRGTRSAVNNSSQVMIVQEGQHTIGLLVDELHAVPQFNPAQIMHTPFAMQGQSMLVTQLIKANKGQLLIQAIDVERLFSLLIDGQIAMPPEPLQSVPVEISPVAGNQVVKLMAA
jgi:chemotaxis signal transduction protein